MVCGELREVSIVPRGAIRGAQIIHKIPLPKQAPLPKPAQSVPTMSSASTAKPAPKPQPVNATVRRARPITDSAWMQELERRMDWLERSTGRTADIGVVMASMRREIDGPTIDELYAETIVRRQARGGARAGAVDGLR
jgi:hypothetical protein